MDALLKVSTSIYDANNKIWHGLHIQPVYGLEDSIGAVALQKLLQVPNHISQICFPSGKKYTNLDIAQWSVSFAEHFKSFNVEQCDVIGLCASNTDYVAPLVFGALLSGLTLSTLDPGYDKDGIKHIYSITKPKLMFCDGNIYDKVKEALKEINLDIPIYTMRDHKVGVPTINEFLQKSVDAKTYRHAPLKLGSNQIAVIMCSSGSTGKPKGVCAAHSILLNCPIRPLGASDILLNFATLFWIGGLWSLVIGTICGATRIISDRPYSTDDLLELVQKYKVTHLLTLPSLIASILASPKLKDYDLSSIVGLMVAGSAFHDYLAEQIQPHIPKAIIMNIYGMTELSGGASLGMSSSDGSSGKLIPNITAKIINDDGQQLGPGESGEICLKTIYSWAGYYDNEQATKDAYRDGWLHTGDLGYFDEEGKLFVVNRKKDTIKCDNFHISPTEIEEVIARLPGVLEVCVIGIPDVVAENLVTAAIVRRPNSELTEDEVVQYVANNVELRFKHLRGGVYFLDSLPKTVSGKNLRREVQAILTKIKNNKCA